MLQDYHERERLSCSYENCDAKFMSRGPLSRHMKVVHVNIKKPKKIRKSKPHKKHPKRPIAALLTGAALPREVEREIIVEGKTFELDPTELSQEVRALKSDSETDVHEDVVSEVVSPKDREKSTAMVEEAAVVFCVADDGEGPDVSKNSNCQELSTEMLEPSEVSVMQLFPGTGRPSKINVWVISEDGVTSREITDIIVEEIPSTSQVNTANAGKETALPVLAGGACPEGEQP